MRSAGCPWVTCVSITACVFAFSYFPLASFHFTLLCPSFLLFPPFIFTFSLTSPSSFLPPCAFPSFPYTQQWHKLCKVASKTQWYRTDTKDGVTVSRCKFGRSRQHHAVIKVDGTIPHHPDTVTQFLQLSMRPGRKLDYLFRNESLVDHIDGIPALALEVFMSCCIYCTYIPLNPTLRSETNCAAHCTLVLVYFPCFHRGTGHRCNIQPVSGPPPKGGLERCPQQQECLDR